MVDFHERSDRLQSRDDTDTNISSSGTSLQSQKPAFMLLQQTFFCACIILSILIGGLSILAYFFIRFASPLTNANAIIDQTENQPSSVLFIISSNVAPTYKAILKVLRFLCIVIFLGSIILLYVICAYWSSFIKSVSVFHNIGEAFLVGLEYFSMAIFLTLIKSPQLQQIVEFPRALFVQAVLMIISLILIAIMPLILYAVQR